MSGRDGFGRFRGVGVGRHRPRGAVEQDHGADGDRVEPTDGHDARDAELAGDDRGVARRSAQRGDQSDHQLRVQPRGVGWGQILGAQDRRDVRKRHTGFRQSAQLGDDTVADIAQVGDAFGHQPAELGEHLHELLDSLGHGADRRGSGRDPLVGGPSQARS